MANTAYFVACVNQDISVNINGALQNHLLKDTFAVKDQSDNSDEQIFVTSACDVEIKANKAKDVIGANPAQSNKLTIYFNDVANPSVYEVTVSTTGLDLYFFIYLGTLTVMDQTGRTAGIKVAKLRVEKKKLQ